MESASVADKVSVAAAPDGGIITLNSSTIPYVLSGTRSTEQEHHRRHVPRPPGGRTPPPTTPALWLRAAWRTWPSVRVPGGGHPRRRRIATVGRGDRSGALRRTADAHPADRHRPGHPATSSCRSKQRQRRRLVLRLPARRDQPARRARPQLDAPVDACTAIAAGSLERRAASSVGKVAAPSARAARFRRSPARRRRRRGDPSRASPTGLGRDRAPDGERGARLAAVAAGTYGARCHSWRRHRRIVELHRGAGVRGR